MSDVTKGGATAGDRIEARLARHFAAELDRARRDYPNLGRAGGTGASAAGMRRPRVWPWLALPVTAVVIVVAASLAMAGWAAGPLSVKSGPVSAGATGVVMGSDGLPTEIEGQHVYRLDAEHDWQKLSGSFLLGAYAVDAPIPCASALPSTHPQSSAEADLVPQCGVVVLTPHASANTEYFFALAPRGLDVLTGWLDGPAVVMRVHTHDPEAAGCAVDNRTACETAVVVEAVVWPALPTKIEGERVYRAADRSSFPTSGSFLLGGLVTMPDVIPPCPAPVDHTTAENDLIPYCTWEAIDGIHVAPKVDALSDLRNRSVVARVHVNDGEAAACPAAMQADCKAAVVVEDVVWTSGAASTSSAPTPVQTSAPSPTATAQSEPSGRAPTAVLTRAIGPFDADGVPTTMDGERVYRATNMPVAGFFYLGGVLAPGLISSKIPPRWPDASATQPPAGPNLYLDGTGVRVQANTLDSLVGSIVVARVARSQMIVDCFKAPCPPVAILTITEVVWTGRPAPASPPAAP